MSCSLIRLTRSCTFRNLHPTTNRSISTSSKRLLATPTNSNSTNLSSQSSQQSDPQLGDYPSVKRENLQLRKWSPRWWDPQEKRNFGETLHPEDDTLGVWAPDAHPNTTPTSALFQFAIAASVAATFATLVYVSKVDRPALPRTYPRDGLAEELGGQQVAAAAEGAFDQKDEEEEDEE